MNRKITWALVALVLIAAPAVVGVLVLGDDGGRRSGALIAAGPSQGGQLTVLGLTPSRQAVDVQSWSWGVTSNATLATGTLSSGKPVVSDLQITKTVDASSPLFVAGATSGKHYATAQLTLYQGGEKPIEYYTYELTDVIITSVQQAGSGNEVPNEQVSLAFRAFKLVYQDQKPDGSIAPTQSSYDLALAKTG